MVAIAEQGAHEFDPAHRTHRCAFAADYRERSED
jgi:hypothetical protein